MTDARTPYHLLGGEGVLRRLVHRFYEIMDQDPRATVVRALHAPDLAEAEEKLFMFLSGWMCGETTLATTGLGGDAWCKRTSETFLYAPRSESPVSKAFAALLTGDFVFLNLLRCL